MSLSTWPLMDDKFLVRITVEITSNLYGVSNRTTELNFLHFQWLKGNANVKLVKGYQCCYKHHPATRFPLGNVSDTCFASLLESTQGLETMWNQIDNFDFRFKLFYKPIEWCTSFPHWKCNVCSNRKWFYLQDVHLWYHVIT